MNVNGFSNCKKSIFISIYGATVFILRYLCRKIQPILYKKINTKIQDGYLVQYLVFNILIFSYIWTPECKKFLIPFLRKKREFKDDSIFFLKVNRRERYTFKCIQQWIDVIRILNADFYFICDNSQLKIEILKYIRFYNEDIKFLKSRTIKSMYLSDNLFSKEWRKATYAHITTFIYANKFKAKSFWNIDADDTMYLMNPIKQAEMLKIIKKISINKNISVLSQDIWETRTLGHHWSFGVTFVNNSIDWLSIFKSVRDTTWIEKYKKHTIGYNIDWFFNYVRDEYRISIRSFYVNNSLFVHWGNFLFDQHTSGIYLWENENLVLPCITAIFRKKYDAIYKILGTTIKINIDIGVDECYDYFSEHVCPYLLA